MEKVVLNKKDVEIEIFEYNGISVELIPFISTELELSLIKLYLEKYFTPNHDETLSYLKEGYFDYWLAEYSIKQAIIESLTNIDVKDDDGEMKITSDTIVDVFLQISNMIKNYSQFKGRLGKQVQAVKDSKSIGIVLDNLATRISGILQSFQSIDPEQLKSLADSLIQKVENSEAAPIFKEAAKQTVIDKQSKSTRKAKEPKE